MPETTHKRPAHFVLLWSEGLLGRWLAGTWLAYSVLATVKTEFLSGADQERWQIVNLITPIFSISFAWWLAISLGVLAIWLFESSFRIQTKQIEAEERLRAEIRALEAKLTPRFKLLFDEAEDIRLVPKESGPRRRFDGTVVVCPAYWVLVRIINESELPIHGCVASLNAVEFKERERDHYNTVPYQVGDYLLTRQHAPITIPAKIPQGINIFAVDQVDRRIRIIWQQELQANEGVFQRVGFYKLHIQVSTENAGNQSFSMEIDWRGNYEKPRVTPLFGLNDEIPC